jgi:alpha-beta hydrolase superfamily lysophospholipase
VEDEIVLAAALRASHPGLKLALFGHSLGSFLAQDFVQRAGEQVDALVMSGTAYRAPPPAALHPMLEAAVQADPLGPSEFWAGRFRDYNQPFGGPTGYEWLSRDTEEVRKYVEDPACGFPFSNEFVRDLFAGFARMREPVLEARVPKALPVLVIQGGDDPIGDRLVATQALLDHYRALGLADVQHHFYPGARHELLNETNRDEVTRDVIAWLGLRLATS